MTSPLPRAPVWTRYWRLGGLHSLDGSIAGNYDGDIAAFWTRVFSGVPANGHVLDVGTGNGPLPALLCGLAPEPMPTFDAVDLADVAPAWLDAAPAACRAAIRFHPGVAAEALPFADARFDLAVSQYGFEYADLPAAVPELARVVRPQGRFALLVHHAGGRLALVAKEEVDAAQGLLAAGGAFDAAAALLPHAARAAREGPAAVSGDADATQARAGYNTAMRAIGDRIAVSAVPDLLEETREALAGLVTRTLSGTPVANASTALAAQREAVTDGLFRNRELVACALDAAGVERLTALFAASGLDVDAAAPIHHGEHLVGWTLSGVRR